jgi:hypothetical protein
MKRIKDTDLAWLAGIIDGEGSLYFIDKRKSKEQTRGWICVGANIASCDADMIEEISKIYYRLGLRFWFSLHKNNERNPNWNLALGIQTSGLNNVKKLLISVYPYLVNKRPLARFLLEYINWRQDKGFGGNRKYIDEKEIEQWFQRFYESRQPKPVSSTTMRRASHILGT